MKKLLIFDTNAIMHHVFHGYKKSASYMTDGTPNYMLRGFHYYINTAIQEHKPDYTVFVFDPEGPTFRHEAYPEYKANRPPKDPEFKIQEPFIREYLECTGYPVITKAGFEGDDVVGTIAVRASKSPHFSDIIIYTGDKDIFQILDEKISVYYLRSKMLVRPNNILDHFKVDHLKVVDYLSLLGDKVDNVKGICGDTSAIKLVNTFNSIENIKENLHKYTAKDLGIQERYYNPIREHFDNNFESILFNKFLITLKTDIDFELTTKTISRNTHSDDLIFTYMFNKDIKIRL